MSLSYTLPSGIFSSIAFVIKDVFVTQTITLVGQKPATPIECQQLMGFGHVTVQTLPNATKFLYLTVGASFFTAPATPENIKALAAFIPVWEMTPDCDEENPLIEVEESKGLDKARTVKRVRAAAEIDKKYKNPDNASSLDYE